MTVVTHRFSCGPHPGSSRKHADLESHALPTKVWEKWPRLRLVVIIAFAMCIFRQTVSSMQRQSNALSIECASCMCSRCTQWRADNKIANWHGMCCNTYLLHRTHHKVVLCSATQNTTEVGHHIQRSVNHLASLNQLHMAKVNSDAIKHTGGAPRTALVLPEPAVWFVPSKWLDQDCGAVIADEINMKENPPFG